MKVFILKQFNDMRPYGEDQIRVFASKEAAENALVHAVEVTTGWPYEKTGQWLEEEGYDPRQWHHDRQRYALFPDPKGGYNFFEIEAHTVE